MKTFVNSFMSILLTIGSLKFALAESKSQFHVFFFYIINGYICDPKRLNPQPDIYEDSPVV
jgi:hypothetical protein